MVEIRDPATAPLRPVRAYPDPCVIPPRDKHTHTFVFLDGRGGNGRDLGVELVTTSLSSHNTLPHIFTGMKFLFPQAKERCSSQFGQGCIPQWFDLTNLGTDHERTDIQHEGLKESSEFIHKLIDAEAALVGINNVILGGLNQGCAQALHALMSYDDAGKGALGGFVGISGWLPFQKQMMKSLDGGPKAENDQAETPIEQISKEQKIALGTRAVNFCREEVLKIAPIPQRDYPLGSLSTPIWLAHGALDEKIRPGLGEAAAQTLEKFGWDVTWMLYDDLPDWFAPYELDDMVIFLTARVGIPETNTRTARYDADVLWRRR